VPPGIGEAIVNATAAADGGRPGDVAGPRATEDVRWRGHNPWDLAANLEGMRLALRTGNGDPGGPFDTGTGTDPIEQFVHAENVSLHERLERHGIEHVWDDYGPGYHRWPYWNRALRQTLPAMMAAFRRPRPPLSPYTYRSIEPRYEVFGWRVSLRRRALEFSSLRLDDLRAPALSGSRSFVLSGSGSATVVTPARFASGRTYRVVARGTRSGARRRDLKARGGRLRIPIQLGPANRTQERFSADGEPTAATKVFLTRVRIRALGL
jgi:hypothetical protein